MIFSTLVELPCDRTVAPFVTSVPETGCKPHLGGKVQKVNAAEGREEAS